MILVLDFGSQYTQLLVRRLREIGFYAELCAFNISHEEVVKKGAKGVILSGGPASVYEKTPTNVTRKFLNLGCRFWVFATECSSSPSTLAAKLSQQTRENLVSLRLLLKKTANCL